MNVLVLTSEPVGAQQLRNALGSDVDPDDTQVMVVAPALHTARLRFWMSDADEAIANADRVRRETLEKLDDAGVAASADTGESDPVEAIEDNLRTFPADRIVVFTHPEGEQRYREDVDPARTAGAVRVPVEQATVPAR